jgi:hypothetical protein
VGQLVLLLCVISYRDLFGRWASEGRKFLVGKHRRTASVIHVWWWYLLRWHTHGHWWHARKNHHIRTNHHTRHARMWHVPIWSHHRHRRWWWRRKAHAHDMWRHKWLTHRHRRGLRRLFSFFRVRKVECRDCRLRWWDGSRRVLLFRHQLHQFISRRRRGWRWRKVWILRRRWSSIIVRSNPENSFQSSCRICTGRWGRDVHGWNCGSSSGCNT